ncbi:MAG: glycosyl hydrolase 53 family protein [Bacteroidales bacterium]|nr:glycosyl hydrolase 53 family protein [Bacteroidales bacterium]
MKRIFIFSLLTLITFCAVAQNITLTFTGRDDNSRHMQLNRVVVINHTQGWQETLIWPDTTLTMQKNIGIAPVGANDYSPLRISQNNPNPFNGTTDVMLTTDKDGVVTMEITDMNGRVVETVHAPSLQAGTHHFRITMARMGTYVLTAHQNGNTSSIKMLCNEGNGKNQINYLGVETVHAPSLQSQRNTPAPGDIMEYVGYATLNGTEVESQRIVKMQNDSQILTLLFDGTRERKTKAPIKNESGDFRVALSLSPFSLNQFQKGYSFVVGDKTASTPEELQSIYRELGSTEMYVRVATKRHVTAEDITDGEPDENANVHTFDQAIRLCQIAKALDMPINPEIMCAYTYMDMDKQQAPRFDEYPEFNYLMNGKAWEELSLDEICVVLEAYGEFVAEAILNTGCTVENWNLGNEANFGFAGISMGLKTAVDPKLEKAGTLKKYTAPVFARGWLKKHVWKHDAKAYAAVKQGILNAYAKLGKDASNVKFSTHIATVVFPASCSVAFFKYMKQNGYEMETAGISYYPSAPSMSLNKKGLLKKTVKKINKKCGLNVFIGEFSYPSGKMDGPFAGWNKKVKGYKHDQQGQANIYADVVKWGKANGMAGIRYWAPDYEGWYTMSMFEFSNQKGTAKTILLNHKEIIEK